MKKTLYIIPGMGQTCDLVRYKKLANVAKDKGYKVVPVDPDWYAPISKQIFKPQTNAVIFGFSMGAILACLVAEKYPCKKLILASTSPIDEFDYVDFEKEMRNYMSVEKAKSVTGDIENISIDFKKLRVPFVKLAGDSEGMKADILISKAKHFLTVDYIKAVERFLYKDLGYFLLTNAYNKSMQKTNNNSLNKKQNVVEEIHGIQVADPYRWLENSNDPEVTVWVAAQNEQTNAALKIKNDRFEIFSNELAQSFKEVSFSNPVPVNGKYFYTERQPNEDQAALYVKQGLNEKPVKLFDPNGKKEGNTITLQGWSPSRTGKYIAYGVSEGGDEMATLYIKDVEKNQELAEKITHCRHFTVQWLPDDSGFFYTRNPRPGSVPKNEETLHAKVYLHVLGADPDHDELIFGAGRPKDDRIGLSLSPNGQYLSIWVSATWTENEIYLFDRKTREIKPLFVNIPSKFSIRFLQGKVLLETNYKANNGRVLWTSYEDLFKPLDEWKELIPERGFLLEMISVTKSKILAVYLVNACSEVCVFDYDGKETEKLPLPKYSSLAGISARRDEEEFFYGVTSFLIPKIAYRYDLETTTYVEYRKMDNPINPGEYEVKQEWFLSKDGTKVPLFIFHKKSIELNGTNPTILNGYGGFGSSKSPIFMKNWVPWTERGGVFAIANIRGGGEFGDAWHRGGIKEKKQNSFDDFIAAAEYLISQKYTSAQHLGIIGGSNGGLLVSTVGVQRPDLLNAVCSLVPLTDMVRFPKFGMALRWIHEYGNPDIKEDLERILSWSPYHNVKIGVKYPNFFFMTANNDSRVSPSHTHKMAAMLQDAGSGNSAIVFTEMDAGHAAHGKPIIKVVESQALILSFFAEKLKLILV